MTARNERAVLNCLLEVARFAATVGIGELNTHVCVHVHVSVC